MHQEELPLGLHYVVKNQKKKTRAASPVINGNTNNIKGEAYEFLQHINKDNGHSTAKCCCEKVLSHGTH